MISILRPLTPPAALISSAASCAACGIDDPATDCASAMTPILIGSFDCALLGVASASATTAAPAASSAATPRLMDLLIATTSLKLQSSSRDDGLRTVYLIALARQAWASQPLCLLGRRPVCRNGGGCVAAVT